MRSPTYESSFLLSVLREAPGESRGRIQRGAGEPRGVEEGEGAHRKRRETENSKLPVKVVYVCVLKIASNSFASAFHIF